MSFPDRELILFLIAFRERDSSNGCVDVLSAVEKIKLLVLNAEAEQ